MHRNLAQTHRYLNPLINIAAAGASARQAKRLAETAGLAGTNVHLTMDADEARRVAIRFHFDYLIAKGRLSWVAGVPTQGDLTTIEQRTADHLGVTRDEVTAALTGHPRPSTSG